MIDQIAAPAADVDLSGHLERSGLLGSETWIAHGVTRRVPGLGEADGNVGYTAPRDEADAWLMRQHWARALPVDPGRIVRVRQVHGNAVHVATVEDVSRGAHPEATGAPIADAIVTNVPGLALTTLHADCLAMLIADPVSKTVAAIHAGWRSTVLDIAGETVRAMQREFGVRPMDVLAYVGPSIGLDRYQVGLEVVEAWRSLAPETAAVHERADGWYFDLKRANVEMLARVGVPADQMDISPVCTASDPENWFSHRGQGPLTGRFAAMIAIKDVLA